MSNGNEIDIDINHRIPVETVETEENTINTNSLENIAVNGQLNEVISNKVNKSPLAKEINEIDSLEKTNGIPPEKNGVKKDDDELSNDETVKEESKETKK